jgi:hypothetical protein
MAIERVVHRYIVHEYILTRQTQSVPVLINVRGYGSVSIPVPAGYPLSSGYPLPAAHYNFSIKHQTTILLHFKIIIIPIALNDNFSTKQHVMDKN